MGKTEQMGNLSTSELRNCDTVSTKILCAGFISNDKKICLAISSMFSRKRTGNIQTDFLFILLPSRYEDIMVDDIAKIQLEKR